jgi:predicted RNA binding protein YcfA (HicA-like mRNA interferase family)
MKLPRDLSGKQFVDCLRRHWGYVEVNQEGSHVVLETADPFHQRIAVPDHSALRVGTLNSLLRAVSRHKGVDRQRILDTL